jgi:hypothetical protein
MRNKKYIQLKLRLIALSIFFMVFSWFVVDLFIIEIAFVDFLFIEIVIASSGFIYDWEKKRMTKLSEVTTEVEQNNN